MENLSLRVLPKAFLFIHWLCQIGVRTKMPGWQNIPKSIRFRGGRACQARVECSSAHLVRTCRSLSCHFAGPQGDQRHSACGTQAWLECQHRSGAQGARDRSHVCPRSFSPHPADAGLSWVQSCGATNQSKVRIPNVTSSSITSGNALLLKANEMCQRALEGVSQLWLL